MFSFDGGKVLTSRSTSDWKIVYVVVWASQIIQPTTHTHMYYTALRLKLLRQMIKKTEKEGNWRQMYNPIQKSLEEALVHTQC